MQISNSFLCRSVLLLFVYQAFCTPNPIETTEAKNDRSQLERWQRRKDNFAKEGLFQRFSPEGVLLEEANYREMCIRDRFKHDVPTRVSAFIALY